MRGRLLVITMVGFLGVVLAGCTKKDTSPPEAHAHPAFTAANDALVAPPPLRAPAADAAAPLPSTRFVGRWVKEGNAMRCAWSGCFVTARFTGTGIGARIRDDGFNLLQVIVDGEFKKVLRLDRTKGETSYALADALPDGVHEIAIYKRAEAKVGDILFVAFEPVKDGKLLPGLPPPDRRIELLGDSITAGYGNEGPNATCTYVNSEQNEYLTYGAITARNLNADHSTLAWSGKTQYEMRQYFDKSLPQNPRGPKWDFAQWQPQVMVLNVGTNDFANVDPGEARFVRQYLELMHDVRAAYPKAFIVIALGSMLSDAYPENRHNLTQARKYMKTVVAKVKAGGETNFDFLEFPEQNHADGLGCGFHPSLKTHQLMADRLTAFIKEHNVLVRRIILLGLVLAACSSSKDAPDAAAEAAAPIASVAVTTAELDAGAPATPEEAKPADVTAYIRAHLPKGGSVEAGDPPKITHTIQFGDSIASIAAADLDLTETYKVEDLVALLPKQNLIAGQTLTIPKPLTHALRAPKDEKLGWPEDQNLKGVFVTGAWASIKWTETVDRVEEHGLNAIVLDGKNYDGYVNYPTKAKIALESGALRANLIPDLARAIRYAHWHNVRIILRIPCFHDPWTDKHLPGARLSIRYTPTGKPIHVDWLDPTLPEAQDYAIELAKEGIEAGADEIQLDYVRFPVHLKRSVAVLPPIEDRPKIIKDFVKRVATVVHADGVKLSLDFFGVAATGIQDDILALGQDIAVVAPEADAISLMSYPSHYGKGYLNFSNPTDHPEIIGIGNKAALEKLKPTGAKTVFRTWLQAFPLGVTNYNSAYLLAQAKSAETSGGHGWLMWSPGCQYDHVWMGWPSVKAKK